MQLHCYPYIEKEGFKTYFPDVCNFFIVNFNDIPLVFVIKDQN